MDLQQDKKDALALGMIQSLPRFHIFPRGDQTSELLRVNWRLEDFRAGKYWDPHVDEFAPDDKIVILEEVPRTQVTDQAISLDSKDTGFFYARLPPINAERMGVPEVDPAVT